MFKLLFLVTFLIQFTNVHAACGGTVRTWDAGNNTIRWDRANNWNANDVPNTASEDAVIVAAARPCRSQMNVTIGCLEIQSGIMKTRDNRTVTIQGDYFKNPTANSLILDPTDDWYLVMDGSAAQSLENQDPLNHLEISNDTSVTFTDAFEIRTTFSLTGTGTTIYVNGDLALSFTSAFTIPSTTTIEVASGKTLSLSGDLTIGGTLVLNAGASLVVASGSTITVSSGGLLKLNGASGNAASLSGNGGYIDLLVSGDIWASYFRMDRVGANGNGLEVSGEILSMNYGEFHFVASSGYAITLNNGAAVPSDMDGLGFYDDNSYGNNRAIDATSYDVSDVSLDDWSGMNSETDPNNRISWGTPAGTVLTLSTNTNSGSPTDPVTAGDPSEEFVIFSFALNQTSTSTDITEIIFTLAGTASAGDVDYIQVFNQGASCQTQGTQIGSNLTMSGDPAETTITIPAATVSVSSTTPHCIHVYLKTTSAAENAVTVGLKINGTTDVTNSFGYSFSDTSGPPVSGVLSTISGDPTRIWKARLSDLWRVNQNWQNGVWPNSLVNCRIGSAPDLITLTASEACQNLTFSTGGEIDWNSTSNTITAHGTLTVESGFSFSNLGATAALVMGGSANQGMAIGTTFPGDLTINNSGGSSSIISVNGDSAISGDLNITSGTLRISSGVTLIIGGDVTVASGTILDIESNGTIQLGNGSTLTVNSGGTLEMVGGTNDAIFTSSGAAQVVINGTIKASKYIFDHLGLNGVTINSGATIDATDNLTSGTFKHPVSDNSTLLRLYKAIPSNTLASMTFDMNGSSATSSTITNIYTDSSIGAGTLSITSYTGDLGGVTYDDDNTYLISWSGASNTIDLTQDATGPANVYQGQTYNMGRFAFKQNLAGASYNDADLTSIKLTLTGTGSANDIDAARIYYDSDCNSTGGTLLGSAGTFTGNPATLTFSGLTGATVETDNTTPPTRCIYVEYDIDSSATNGAKVGVKITQSADVVDDQSYGISSGTPPPVTLGTEATIIGSSTTWTGGAGTTDWYTAGNWNGGVPTSSLNCIINSATFDPVIASGTGVCKSVDIGNGDLTISAGATLEIYGSFTSTGTFTHTGTLTIRDDGATTVNQVVDTSAGLLGTVILDKDVGGSVTFAGSNLSINSLTLNGANTSYQFIVSGSQTLTLPNGVTINNGTFRVDSAGIVEVGNGQTVLVSGGIFMINGTADSYPQNLATKGKITVSGAGTWSFNSTSGSVSLQGFQFDYIDTNGLRIGGTTALSQLTGGQFTNLSGSYASVRAFQFNTTGSLPGSATNIGWNWSPNNTYPANTEAYLVAYSSGCASQTIDFTGWFGDWYENTATFDVSTKVSATTCTITLSGSATPVNLMEFDATPYNSAIKLNWKTSLEIDHQGFNVFRRAFNSDHLLQINHTLIKSLSLGHEGIYQFIDYDVENGIRYFYYIQDVAIGGATQMHGPVTTIPMDGLGMPTTDLMEFSVGINPDGDHYITGNEFEVELLGGGVSILAKTMHSMRLKIIPGELVYNEANHKISIVDYNPTLTAGSPELLERTFLIEIEAGIGTAEISDSKLQERLMSSIEIGPAPTWFLDGEKLQPQLIINPEVYNKDSFIYQAPVVIDKIIKIGFKNYLKLIVRPTNYNPVTKELIILEEAIVDIGLDGEAWSEEVTIDPKAVLIYENGLKLGYRQNGIYSISYDEIAEQGLDGPFADTLIENLRGYYFGDEIPIEVESLDDTFNQGDMVRVYLQHNRSIEDDYNYLVLRSDSLDDNAKRIAELDGSIEESGDIYEADYVAYGEENNFIQLRDSLGTYEDHFFWSQIYAPYFNLPQESYQVIPVDLKNLKQESEALVEIDLYVKGTHDGFGLVYEHHLALFANNIPFMLDDVSFETNDLIKVTFKVPSTYFYGGINYLKIQVLGDLVPENHYDVVFIDRAVVRYKGERYLEEGTIQVRNGARGSILDVHSEVPFEVYDVSDISDVRKVTSFEVVETDYGYYGEFFANSGEDYLFGRDYVIHQPGKEKSFDSFRMLYGAPQSLREISGGADMLIIGHDTLLDAVRPLIEQRTIDGLAVRTISPEQIYNEFSWGRVSSQAIREFVEYSLTQWRVAPKYLLFLGDGTYDPRGYLGNGVEEESMPVPLVKGQIFDFASDSWLATLTNDASSVPAISVGRIPTNDLEKLTAYISKILDYERGYSAPESLRQLTVFSDQTDDKYKFASDMREITSFKNYQVDYNERDHLNDLEMKEIISESFDEPPLMITFMGHGAINFWASRAIFDATHISNFDNQQYPLVFSFNCSNGDFTDPYVESLGEQLILKESGGAIIFIGSTAMTSPVAQKQLAQKIFKQFDETKLGKNEIIRIGDLFLKAKQELGHSLYGQDVQNSYLLMGDPSLKLPRGAFAAKIPVQVSGGGGCSAHASGGSTSAHWSSGILEFLLILLVPLFFRWKHYSSMLK